jgi:hypothetical protein
MNNPCPKCHGLDVLGHEVRGLYDGVLFWQCCRCGWSFPRDFGAARTLQIHSVNYAGAMNRGRDFSEHAT